MRPPPCSLPRPLTSTVCAPNHSCCAASLLDCVRCCAPLLRSADCLLASCWRLASRLRSSGQSPAAAALALAIAALCNDCWVPTSVSDWQGSFLSRARSNCRQQLISRRLPDCAAAAFTAVLLPTDKAHCVFHMLLTCLRGLACLEMAHRTNKNVVCQQCSSGAALLHIRSACMCHTDASLSLTGKHAAAVSEAQPARNISRRLGSSETAAACSFALV